MHTTTLVVGNLVFTEAAFQFTPVFADLNDVGMLIAVVFVLVVILAIIFAWSAIVIYNKVNPLKHRLNEAEANIEVMMQKRMNLAEALLDVAERYAGHEKLIHLRMSRDRRDYQRTKQAILFVTQLVTTYPALKADQTYMRLMNELQSLEAELQSRYETYNSHAREYNQTRTSFPAILFANVLSFSKANYLEPSLWHPHGRVVASAARKT